MKPTSLCQQGIAAMTTARAFTDSRSYLAVRGIVVFALLATSIEMSAADKKEADVPAATIAPTTNCGCVFGDREVEVGFRIEATRALKGRIVWRYSLGAATIASREIELTAGPDAPAKASIKLPIPAVKDGIVLQTILQVSIVEAGQNAPLTSIERTVAVFPSDPFADRSEWLKKLKIKLYDPIGTTKKTLTAAKIPFDEEANPAALAELTEGLLLVGEGISFKDDGSLAAIFDKLVLRGIVVLCLAPADGEIAVPGLSTSPKEFDELVFRRDIVRRLDKRLAAEGWPTDDAATRFTILIKNGENGIRGEVSKDATGWPWVEVRSHAGPGRFAICGQSIIDRWDSGPTPRFLFAKLLEHLTDVELNKTR